MSDKNKRPSPTGDKLERAKNQALGKHDDNPGVADHIGEAAGGIGGVTAGAAIGSIAGPIGTVIGGIAGALGGWWTGRAVAEAATAVTTDDDNYYRSHYETSATRLADRTYDDVRPAYHLGHVASRNPDYRGRSPWVGQRQQVRQLGLRALLCERGLRAWNGSSGNRREPRRERGRRSQRPHGRKSGVEARARRYGSPRTPLLESRRRRSRKSRGEVEVDFSAVLFSPRHPRNPQLNTRILATDGADDTEKSISESHPLHVT
jgi:hypothetical protein